MRSGALSAFAKRFLAGGPGGNRLLDDPHADLLRRPADGLLVTLSGLPADALELRLHLARELWCGLDALLAPGHVLRAPGVAGRLTSPSAASDKDQPAHERDRHSQPLPSSHASSPRAV